MNDPFQLIAVMVLGSLAPLALWLGWGARAIVRRLDRVPTRTVRELAPGPAEVSGALRAEAATLRTLAGAEAVAVRTRLSCTARSGGKSRRTLALVDVVEAVPVILSDAGGSCVLAVDPAIVLGSERSSSCAPEVLAQARPDLLERLRAALLASGEIVQVHVEETWVPEGATGFVSGTAVPDGAEPEEGYRAAGERFRMHGDEEHPLIVSSWSERRVRRHVAMPSNRLYWVAAASLLVVIAILAAGRWMASAGGVP